MLKRSYQGTYHHMSEKHFGRYVDEFAGRHNMRNDDTIKQMGEVANSMFGKRVRYRGLGGLGAWATACQAPCSAPLSYFIMREDCRMSTPQSPRESAEQSAQNR